MTIMQQQIMDQLLREDTILFDEMTADVCEAVCGLHDRGVARYNGADSSLTLNEAAVVDYLA